MGKLWLRLKLLFYTIRIARNPLDITAALAINPCLTRLKYLDKSKQILAAQPKSNSLLCFGWVLLISLERLRFMILYQRPGKEAKGPNHFLPLIGRPTGPPLSKN